MSASYLLTTEEEGEELRKPCNRPLLPSPRSSLSAAPSSQRRSPGRHGRLRQPRAAQGNPPRAAGPGRHGTAVAADEERCDSKILGVCLLCRRAHPAAMLACTRAGRRSPTHLQEIGGRTERTGESLSRSLSPTSHHVLLLGFATVSPAGAAPDATAARSGLEEHAAPGQQSQADAALSPGDLLAAFLLFRALAPRPLVLRLPSSPGDFFTFRLAAWRSLPWTCTGARVGLRLCTASRVSPPLLA